MKDNDDDCDSMSDELKAPGPILIRPSLGLMFVLRAHGVFEVSAICVKQREV